MENKKIKTIICIGMPGSGKSTWANNYIKKNSNTVIVSRDHFRFMLRDSPFLEPKLESMVSELMEQAIVTALNFKCNVIIDNTNLKASYINDFIKLVEYKSDIEFMIFDVPYKTCLERNNSRDRVVPENIMKEMHNNYKNLIDCYVFQNRAKKPIYENKFIHNEYMEGLEEAVLFDIDGTLSLLGRRSTFDWDKVDVDDINEKVIEQIEFHRSKGRKIILVTGRDAASQNKTEYWLNFYNIYYDELYMRPKDDVRKDYIIKKEIYNEHIKPKYNIYCVYDDRISVIKKCWHKLNLFCFTVNQGLEIF